MACYPLRLHWSNISGRYGRVDGVLSGGRFLVMEAELVEPELFFGYAPEATKRFAENLIARERALPGR